MILNKNDIKDMRLEPADILAIRGKGPFGFLARNIFVPYTDKFHHALVWETCGNGKDYIILESVNKGLAVGRLSWYHGDEVAFYRCDKLDIETRDRACDALTEYGRSPYDWLMYLRLLRNVLAAEWLAWKLTRRLKKLRAEDLPYKQDSWLVCTEAVATAFELVDFPIVPRGVPPLPSAIEQARIDGVLKEVDPWTSSMS